MASRENPSSWMTLFYKQCALGRIYDPSKGFSRTGLQCAPLIFFFSGLWICEIRPLHIKCAGIEQAEHAGAL